MAFQVPGTGLTQPQLPQSLRREDGSSLSPPFSSFTFQINKSYKRIRKKKFYSPKYICLYSWDTQLSARRTVPIN